MRYQAKQTSLEGDLPLPVPTEEPGVEYQEPENPFLDSLTEAPVVEASPEVIETVIAEDAGAVVDVVHTVEDVSVAIESLEAVALHLHQLKDEGKAISVESLTLLNIGVDNAVRKFPAFKKSVTVDSLENFTLDASNATNVSLENIGAKIKAGYEALVAFLKSMWEKFKAFIGNIVSGATQAEKAARANLEALKTANKDRAATAEITIPAILNNPVLSTQAITKLTDVIGSIGMTNYREVIVILNRIKAGENITIPEASEAMHKIFDAYGRMKEDVYLGNLSFENDQFPPSVKMLEGEDRTAKALKLGQVKEFTEANIKLCASINILRKSANERHQAIAQMTAAISAVMQKAQNPDGPSNTLQVIRSMIQMLSQLNAFETRILGRSVKVANAINQVCSQSIKAHG